LARKILLADDSVTAQNMGRKILADAGYDVITVNNGSAALKKIAELKPDLIVLDVYMPGYSGLEVCQRVKETGDTSRIPILLTVGKLEPFKPEEARRVRADGYIVKPFEASELLSALAKLEDKIVPRAETSKPGRFARTIAVVEEGRYDKTVSSGEDSGWKDRIGFPSGKKKKEPESEDVDDSSIYNPVNKDLRTTIDRGANDRRAAQPAKPEDTRVDLGALAPPGLPKDVTPEEIAALAAAAAQIKGAIGGAAETVASDSAAEPVASEQAAQPQVAAQPEAKAPETVQAKEEEKEKVEAAASETKADALAESKAEQKIDPIAEKPSEATAEAAASPSPADVAAAIAPLEAVTYLSANTSGASESRHSSDDPVTMAVAAGANGAAATPRWAAVATALLPEESTLSLEQEMQKAYAAFAAAEVAYAPSAVAVAEPPAVASPEESSAIESSMTATASAAEFAPTESVAASEPAQLISSAVKTFEVAATASVEAQPAISPAPEAAPLQSVESKDAVSEQTPAIEARIVESESTATEPAVAASAPQDSSGAPAAALQTEQIQTEPIKAEQVSADALPAKQMPPSPASEEKAWGEQKNDEQKNQDQRPTEPRQEEARPENTSPEETRSEDHPTLQSADVPAPAEISESIPTPNLAEPARFGDAPVEQSSTSPSASQASSEPAGAVSETTEESSASVPVEARAEESVSQDAASQEAAPKDPVHKESEIAATTAAAWASWRRIRETGDARSAAPSAAPAKNAESSKIEEERKDERKEEASERHEAVAMAVAAGAEKAPEAMPAAERDSDSGEIANIVDSVLADLRPKIVAEISKKMGKKK